MSQSPIVVGLGEVLWDCFADSRRPGGAPANVAFHANQLGFEGTVCSRVGDDELGAELVKYLADNHLSTTHIQRDKQRPTGTVTVDTAESESPQYTIHEGVAWDHLQFTDDLAGLARSAGAVCFGTLAQRSEESRQTIHKFLDQTKGDCLRVYDVNLRQEYYSRELIEQSLRKCTIVKLNEDEVRVLCRLFGLTSPDPKEFASFVQEEYDVSVVCVTRGGEGCHIYDRSQSVEIAGRPVEVADAVGAGDAFTAGLIFGQMQGWSTAACGEFANQVGGLVASRQGAMPDLKMELAQLIREVDGN